MGNYSKLKITFIYVSVYIDILFFLYKKKQYILADKLCKMVKSWRFPVRTKLSKMTLLQ